MGNYWGGNTVTSNAIRRLDAENFEELYQNYFETGVPCAYTRAEYQDLDPAEKNKIKLGAYITACSFREGTTERSNAAANNLQLIIIDVDGGKEAKNLYNLRSAIGEQMGDLNYLVHTTISHTEKNPRLRVIVPVEPCSLDLRGGLTQHVADLLGLSTLGKDENGINIVVYAGYDKCSTVTSQPFFRPVAFADDQEGSVIASRVNGRDLTVSEVPVEVMEDLPFEATFAFPVEGIMEDGEDLEHLPIPELKMDWVKSALSVLNPDEEDEYGNSYTGWYKVCCALRHQFRSEDEAEEAFNVFDEWSATGDKGKYLGREATYRKWTSFVPLPKGRRPITMRSIFQRAIKAGWDYTQMAARLDISFERWLQDTNDKTVLAREGVKRIAAMPFKDANGILQIDMLAKLRNKLKATGVVGATSALLSQELKREQVKAIPKESPDDKPPWLQPWCYVSSSNLYFHTISKAELTPAAFNAVYSRELMHLIPDGQVSLNGKPPMLPSDYANNVKQVPTPYGVTYDPSYGGDHTYIKFDGHIYVNRYRPPNARPIASQAEEAEKLFREFLHWMVGDKWLEDHIIDMIAFAIQNPDRKVRVATLFFSVEGIGKTLFGEILANVFGQHNTKQVNPKELESGFNSYAADTHLLILEELHAAGQNRKVIMDVLKEVISNEVISVTEKYKNATKVINKMLVFGFTNRVDAVSLTPSDRRYLCIRCKPTVAAAEKQSEKGYFDEVKRLKMPRTKKDEPGREGLMGGIVYFFNNHKVSDTFNPDSRAPKTQFREQLIQSSENPTLSEIRELIADEDHPLIAKDVISYKELRDALNDPQGRLGFPRHLRELGFVLYVEGGTRSFSISGTKTSIWYNPSVHESMFGTPEDILRERANEALLKELCD